MAEEHTHVLIIGAGITGLLLAQALKARNIPAIVYERDPTPDHRGAGWGLALHWALDTFVSLVPEELQSRLAETYVDPESTARGDNGRFPFLNLSSGERRWENLSRTRVRVSREKLRKLLMEGVSVEWNRNCVDVSERPGGGVQVTFEGEFAASGSLLVGCDGTRSRVRRALCEIEGSESQNKPLPVRLLGTSVVYPEAVARRFRAVDPFFFQGADPETDAFLFFAFQDTPSNNARPDKNTFSCQVIVSWPYRAGFQGKSHATEVPATDGERLKLMKEIARGWASPFCDAVQHIPDGAQVQSIRLEDWVPECDAWSNLGGKATLVGDAAHAMTMYRGEAANHGITDVRRWLDFHLPVLQHDQMWCGGDDVRAACRSYEHEMVERTRVAVLASRRACLDAHDYARIDEHSPLVSRRAVVPDL